jgi:predicted HAD superfamily Cof-like phosphohydrolase
MNRPDVRSMLREFHDKYAPVPEDMHDVMATRRKLLADEVAELLEADADGDRAGVIKEAADVAYVLYGTAHCYGFDLDAAIAAVHESNMTKDMPATPGGKAIKGAGYREADLSAVPGLKEPVRNSGTTEMEAE